MPHRTFDNPHSLEAREFLSDQAHYLACRDAKLRQYKAGVRAYFTGACDTVPTLPTVFEGR